jgi:hypothetical protein
MDGTGTLLHGSHRLGPCGDDVIVRTRRSTDHRQGRESVPDQTSSSVEGSNLPRTVCGMDQLRATEARHLERFWMNGGFEALSTRFRAGNPEAEPSDRVDQARRTVQQKSLRFRRLLD